MMTTATTPAMPGRLRIGHANVKNRPGAVRELLGRPLDSAAFNEAHRRGPRAAIVDHPDYRCHAFTGPDLPFDGRQAETPTAVRHTLPNLGVMHEQVAEPSTPTRFAPARVATTVLYRHPFGDVAHVNVHLHALIRNAHPLSDRVRSYAASVEALAALLDYLDRARGYLTVVTGDVNLPDAPDFARRGISPHEIAREAGLDVWAEGIDFVAWSKRLGDPVRRRVIPRGRLGSDHPGMISAWSE